MKSEEFEKGLTDLPAQERQRLVVIGRRFGSTDTLAQAEKTLNGLKAYSAHLAENGFIDTDGEQLQCAADALRLAGVGRATTQTEKKTTNKQYAAALKQAKAARRKAITILQSGKNALLQTSDADSSKAAAEIAATLEKVGSTGSDAHALVVQLELLSSALASPTIAAAVAKRGGPIAADDIQRKVKELQDIAPSTAVPLGTPAETERMDLLDGVIVELTRSARRAARSASNETGEDALAKAFELTSLYP